MTLHTCKLTTQNFKLKCVSFGAKFFAHFIIIHSLQLEWKLPYFRITGDKDNVNFIILMGMSLGHVIVTAVKSSCHFNRHENTLKYSSLIAIEIWFDFGVWFWPCLVLLKMSQLSVC